MPPTFAPETAESLPLHVVTPDGLDAWRGTRPAAERAWLEAAGFAARPGQLVLMPGEDGRLAGAAFGFTGSGRRRFMIAEAARALPADTVWHLEGLEGAGALAEAALGWLFASYRFDRYATRKGADARLKAPPGVSARRLEAIAAGEFLTRDLVNTPANDMGPEELEVAARALAAEFGASVEVTAGEDLLGANLPLVHAVGRASPRAPRLIDMRWGPVSAPLVTLVGKGVCFDSGGLNLKPASSMGIMKKDMGGAATVLGLARMIMALGLGLRLRVLIPAVENAVAGNAFRPGDILPSRKGLSVEINNTDAEGRLVLADALALASEEVPALLVSMATLTGAARVALGPDLPPFYTDDDKLAEALSAAGTNVADPIWRMPFWAPYEEMIEPGIADLDNAPAGGMAGSITAALFLRRFAGEGTRYVHFDIYAWSQKDQPGRSKGGFGQGARAILELLPGVLET